MKTAELIYAKFKELIPKIEEEIPFSKVVELVEYSNNHVIDGDDEKSLVKVLIETINDLTMCHGCASSTGETKLWCCNHCGKRTENF